MNDQPYRKKYALRLACVVAITISLVVIFRKPVGMDYAYIALAVIILEMSFVDAWARIKGQKFTSLILDFFYLTFDNLSRFAPFQIFAFIHWVFWASILLALMLFRQSGG
jgi:hypothetical protein